jgi:DNA-binding response OmpR family regulator
MVVDDEPSIVELLEILLEDDYDVIPCTRSAKAMQLAVQTQPQLTLLDWMMPEPDGYQLLLQFRQHTDLFKMPVILMTANTQFCNLSSQDLANLNATLTSKPFDNEALLALIQKRLG